MTDPRPVPLDLATVDDVVDRVLAGHERALAATRQVAAQIGEAVDVICGRLASGGRLHLTGTDPTAERVLDLVTADLVAEFGLAAGVVVRAAPEAVSPTARDAVLVVSTGTADGSPALGTARRRNAGSVWVTTATTTATTEQADVVIAPAAGPEPIRRVERIAAGTALKAVLDALTTAVVAQLGRVHGDLPVDLVAGSDAQREQVVVMIAEIAGVDAGTARAAAQRHGHDVRVAVLALAGGLDPAAASTLAANRRTLRDALAGLPRTPPVSDPRARMGP